MCLSGGCVRAVGRAAKAFLSTTCGDSASPTSVSTNDRIFSVSPASWSSRTWFSTSSAACFRFSYSFWPKARIMMRHNERERAREMEELLARQKRYSYMTPYPVFTNQGPVLFSARSMCNSAFSGLAACNSGRVCLVCKSISGRIFTSSFFILDEAVRPELL